MCTSNTSRTALLDTLALYRPARWAGGMAEALVAWQVVVKMAREVAAVVVAARVVVVMVAVMAVVMALVAELVTAERVVAQMVV